MRKKVVLISMAAALVLGSFAFVGAEEYWSVGAYYEKGKAFLASSQYTSAIAEFKKALRVSPNEASSRIELTNSYLARASYYANKMSDYPKAATDIRSALFYLRDYDSSVPDGLTVQAIKKSEENLDIVLQQFNFSKTAKNRLETAKKLRSQGEFAAAAYEYKKAMLDNNYRRECLEALGDIYAVLNLQTNSIAYYEQSMSIDDTRAELHLKLARAYEQAGNAQGATEHYNFALTRSEENGDILDSLLNIWTQKVAHNPNDPESHANLGAIYQKSNQLDKALEEYKIAEKLNPSNPTTRLNMGTLYQLQKQYTEAIAAYDSVLTLYPNNAMAHFYKAQCLFAQGNKDEALAEYKLASKADPKNQDIKAEVYDILKDTMTPQELLAYLYSDMKNTTNPASVYYRFAFELHKAGKLKDAVPFYEETIKLDPDFTEAYINLAQDYKQQNDLANAKAVLERAKTRFPADEAIDKQYKSILAEASNNLYNKASDLFAKNDFQGAINVYKQIAPPTSEAYVGIAASCQAMNNTKEAVDYYKRALTLDSANPDILYYLASSLSSLNDNANAKVYLKKAISIAPNKKEAKELLAYIVAQENTSLLDKVLTLYDTKNYPLALSTVNMILAQDSKHPEAYYYRALIYDAQKKYQLAIADYNKAISFNPKLDVAYYSMAVDYDALAQYKSAVVNYKKYLTMDKDDNEYTKYAKKRLADLKAYDK